MTINDLGDALCRQAKALSEHPAKCFSGSAITELLKTYRLPPGVNFQVLMQLNYVKMSSIAYIQTSSSDKQIIEIANSRLKDAFDVRLVSDVEVYQKKGACQADECGDKL